MHLLDSIDRRAFVLGLAGAMSIAGRRAVAADAEPPLRGRVEALSIDSQRTGSRYPIRLYEPPPGPATAGALPIVYLLDAEWRLETLARIAEARQRPIRIAGIANEATRNRDDVPANACIPGGGGQAAFFEFVRDELLPFVETRVRVEPTRRALMGHSFGGAFALYALFREPPDGHRFSAYLAADPAIRCIGDSAIAWEAGYAARSDRLPVRLHFAYANPISAPFAERIERRDYRGLRLAVRAYPGGHDGMIPAAFADALDFAFAPL